MLENTITVNGCDRTLAILIIEGKVYKSESNHQDCFLEYCQDIGHELKRLLDDEDAYFDMLDDLVARTHNMKCKHEAYGFDVFEKEDTDILVAHDKITLDENLEWAKEFGAKNNAKVGYYVSFNNNDVLLID